MSVRMRGAAVGLLLLGLGCASSGSSFESEATTAPGADLAAYTSFGWQPVPASPSGTAAPRSIADANVRNAIRAELLQKGYQEVEADPDLLIGFESSAVLAEKVSSPVRIGVGMGSFGGPVGVGVGTSVPVGGERVSTSQETRLTIRAVDPRGNQEVWLGTTTGKLALELGPSAAQKAVASALAKFPSRVR